MSKIKVSVQLCKDSRFYAKVIDPEVKVPTYRTDFCILIYYFLTYGIQAGKLMVV